MRHDHRRPFSAAALVGLLGLAIAVFAPAARMAAAHVGHVEGSTLYVDSARLSADGDEIAFDLTILNGFGYAVTFRKLTASVGGDMRIERRRGLFGAELWQSTPLLRLEADEVLRVAAPDYRVVLSGVGAPVGGRVTLSLKADFGPFGPIETAPFTVGPDGIAVLQTTE